MENRKLDFYEKSREEMELTFGGMGNNAPFEGSMAQIIAAALLTETNGCVDERVLLKRFMAA